MNGMWILIGVLVLVTVGYLACVWRDNDGISFQGLPTELRQEARDAALRVRDHLTDYCNGEH